MTDINVHDAALQRARYNAEGKPREKATGGKETPAATEGRETGNGAVEPAKPKPRSIPELDQGKLHRGRRQDRSLVNASDAIGIEVANALDDGDRVVLHTDGGREVEITNAEVAKGGGYKLVDSHGNPWGIMGIATDASGKIRLEITPHEANPFGDIKLAELLPEERAELEAAQAAVEKAEAMQGAFDEAAQCLKRAGA